MNIVKANTASYHENGKVAYAEISYGRIVLEKGSDVEEIHINKKTASSFDTVIIANNGGAEELPERITRDAVTVSEETLVVKVESNGSSENVYVYADGATGTKGSTQKITEGENKQNENVNSALGQLVLDNGATADKAQTEEQQQSAKTEAVNTAEVANIDYWIDAAAKQFAGGSGTEIDPYLVTNNRELSLIAKLVNDSETTSQYRTAYYKITKDIDLSGKVWTPIGFDGTDFAGAIFADSKVKISNLSNKNEKALLTNTEDSTKKTRNYGFVGKATGTISISNLQFEDIDAQYVNGYAGGFGGVVGYFDNTTGATNILTIDNVDVLSGTILCTNSQTGGIVGKAYGDKTIVSNCTNAANVSGSYAAGIIGFASNSNETIEITGSSNSGNVTASVGRAAGILGSATIKQLTIGACLNSGTLLGTSDVAGIATPDRVYDNIVFYDLENSGNITSSSNRAAGISTLLSNNLFVQKGEDKKETFIKNTGSVNSGNADAAGIFGGNVQVDYFYAYNCKFKNEGTISCAIASTVSGTPAQSDMGISALFGYTAKATFEDCEFINKGNVTSDKANAGLIFAALRNTGSNTGYTFTNCSYKNEGSISGVGANNKQDYDQYFTAKLFGYICYTSKIVEGSSLTVQSE